MKTPNVPKAIDLFCGAGGASLGLLRFGYDVKGYDNWEPTFHTHRLNKMKMDLVDLATFRFPKSKRGKIDLLWGGPPCQPFSGAVLNEGEWDPRDGFPHYLRTLKRLRPRMAVLENVAGLTYKRHAAYLAAIIRSIEELGYIVDHRVLDCSDYRIPQARKRLIIIARLDEAPRWPKINPNKITVAERLGTDGRKNPKGSRVIYTKSPTMTGGFRGALLFNGRGRPLDLNLPSLTIYASGGNHTHWFDTKGIAQDYFADLKRRGKKARRTGKVPGARRLTNKQMALLQSFPKDFQFAGPPSIVTTQIGNATPPRLAYLIVKYNQPT